jgi:nitrile hydratase accessory protein
MAEARGLDLADALAPPRRNGELVFEAPWESRIFGVTMALCEAGRLDFAEFRRALIAEIAAFEAASQPPSAWCYYERWAAALEHVLARRGVCGLPEIEARVAALAARPPGHDHTEESPSGGASR